VLLIVGGDPGSDWTMGAWVSWGGRLIPLGPDQAAPQAGSPAVTALPARSESRPSDPDRDAEPGPRER
jgi:hypothetical protein